MPTQGITPRLADSLRSLAESQLQAQAARSASVDAGALGVMAVDAAIATIIIDTGGANYFWILALALLGLSLGLAIRALRLLGAEQNGPLVADVLDARAFNDDSTVEEALLKDLATETFANEQALARKDPLMTSAVTCLILGILVELAAWALL